MAQSFEAQEAVIKPLNAAHTEPGVIGVGECVWMVNQNTLQGGGKKSNPGMQIRNKGLSQGTVTLEH